jgi:hypothetical protein
MQETILKACKRLLIMLKRHCLKVTLHVMELQRITLTEYLQAFISTGWASDTLPTMEDLEDWSGYESNLEYFMTSETVDGITLYSYFKSTSTDFTNFIKD